jgi:hypothetical protein
MLLYTGGMALDPVVHAHAAAAAEAADAANSAAAGSSEVPAAEEECGLCKLARTARRAAPCAYPVSADDVIQATFIAIEGGERAPPARTPLQPRAPPIA